MMQNSVNLFYLFCHFLVVFENMVAYFLNSSWLCSPLPVASRPFSSPISTLLIKIPFSPFFTVGSCP